MNSFGRNFRITIFGESHGEALGVVVDGVPAGMSLSAADFKEDLARRQGGTGLGTTPRREADVPEIVSGVFEGHTTGAPLTVLFRNENTRSGDYAKLADHPRPSHADLVASQKFDGYNDPCGGGHFSGRVTLGLVAAGVIAKKILSLKTPPLFKEGWQPQADGVVKISSEIVEIGGCRDHSQFESIVAEAVKAGDSIGGVIECRAAGVPAGVGEPFFDSVESVVSHLIFSIPGVKGVEFGSGFAGAALRGSENNDPIIDTHGTTATNNSGGINGGITNGNEIVVRIAVKPTASISRAQQTYNFATDRIETLEIGGRHDACIALRAAVVAQACVAIAIVDLLSY
jgi:chorismate synthase